MTEIIEETKNGVRSLFIEKSGTNQITVRKRKKNKDFEVDLLVFDKSQLEGLLEYQASLYKEIENPDFKHRILKALKKILQ